jgi:hypothetical protein
MSIQSTTLPASERTLQRIQRLEEKRTRLYAQPWRTADDQERLRLIDRLLTRLWTRRRQQQATERPAAQPEEETEAEAVERRRAARQLTALTHPTKPVQITDWDLTQLDDVTPRTKLSDDEVRAIRRAYDRRQRGDVTALAQRYGVGENTIGRIGQRIARADVPEEGTRYVAH